jgi:hypothetical protein
MYTSQPAKTSSVFNAAFVLDVDIPMGRDLRRLMVDLTATAVVSGTPTAKVLDFVDKVELIANGSDYFYTWQGADLVAFFQEAAKVAARNETIVTGTAKYARGILFAEIAKADIQTSLTMRFTFKAPNGVDSNITGFATSLVVSYLQGSVRYSVRQEYSGIGGSSTSTDVALPQKKGPAIWMLIAEATEYMTRIQITDKDKTYRLDATWASIRALAQELLNVTDAAGLYTLIPLDPLACTKDTVIRTTQATAEAMRLYTRHISGVYRSTGTPSKMAFSAGEWARPFRNITDEADQIAWVEAPAE